MNWNNWNKRWAWLCAVASLLLLFVLLSKLRRGHPQEPGQRPAQESAARLPKLADSRPAQEQDRFPGTERTSISQTILAGASRREQLEERMRSRNVPIDFWGRVLDQHDTPVSGVKIEVRVRQWGRTLAKPTTTAHQQYYCETGTDGSFHLLGAAGDVLTIESIQKEGYLLSPKSIRAFSYLNRDPGLPTEDKPHVFRMWKKAGNEPLSRFRASRMIPYDGSPVWVDLLAGRMTEELDTQGDLKITLRRSPQEIALTNREPFDWHATITALSGGIQGSTDEFMYLAPEEGYSERLELAMPRTAKSWTPNKQVSFFVKGQGGSYYGRVTLEFRCDYSGPRTGFTVEAAVNPNGSRHLEP